MWYHPDYMRVVKIPLDLGTIGQRLAEGAYQGDHPEIEFAADVFLGLEDALRYNRTGTTVHIMAYAMEVRLQSPASLEDFDCVASAVHHTSLLLQHSKRACNLFFSGTLQEYCSR